MGIGRVSAVTAAGLLVAQMAGAAQVTLTYDIDQQPYYAFDPCAGVAQAGPVTGNMPNQCLYGIEPEYVLLGDDGFNETARITADPGYVFDLLSADLFAIATGERISVAAVDAYSMIYENLTEDEREGPVHGVYYPGEWPLAFLAEQTGYAVEGDPESGLRVDGYRNGTLVAQQIFQAGGSAVAFDPAFAGLDRVTFTATNGGGLYGFPGFISSAIVDDYYYACQDSCLSAAFDNVVLRVSPVPLPAAGLLLLGGLAGLAAGVRRRRASPCRTGRADRRDRPAGQAGRKARCRAGGRARSAGR